ncbi:MAG: nuclease [Robiginitomaculum sp.]|nr:MAG: nuclease [Robiginitomaculum sp.]
MKPFLLAILLCLCTHASPVQGRDTLSGPIAAEMVRVVDGDTLAVRALIWPGQHIDIKVRLAGIDAPELFRPRCAGERLRANEARDFLIRRSGPKVMLKAVHLGKYAGRVIARVENSAGEDLSALLLAAGLAHSMANKEGWCLQNG